MADRHPIERGSAGSESLGVVVLAYGDDGQYAPLVDSLLAEGVAPASILVVHNPAQPGEPPPRVPPGCDVLQAQRNLGYAAGMNLGIARMRERRADLLLLLTHDARLRSGALEALVGAAARQSDFGVLGPALMLSGGDRPFSFGGITRANGTAAHLRERPAQVESGVAPCDWVDGGTMLVRSSVLELAGGFDESFWGYCEESDLCLRVVRAGFRVGVVVEALADQAPGGPKRLGAWAYLQTRNGAEYARRAVGLRGALTIEARAAGLVAFNLARVALRAVRRRPGGVREPWALAVGFARGAIDFLRRRWGPPPSNLPGMGDVSNV
jgi:N-acetylglucosaminyl-diphospho-decaprenol L-rhamnosyltransferase